MRRSCLLGLTLFLLLGLLAACGEAPDKENPRLPASEACLTGRVAAVEGAQLGLDLSQTRLSPAEQGAVGVALSWQRDCPVLTGTWEALADQGYIDRERVEWDDGLFLSLAEENPSGALTFTAQKWRSGTGAYWFTHCTARQNPSGHWDGYTVGGEAIS